MANFGNKQFLSRHRETTSQKQSIFKKDKFPQVRNHVTAPPTTDLTDLSDRPQPEPGAIIANVMRTIKQNSTRIALL